MPLTSSLQQDTQLSALALLHNSFTLLWQMSLYLWFEKSTWHVEVLLVIVHLPGLLENPSTSFLSSKTLAQPFSPPHKCSTLTDIFLFKSEPYMPIFNWFKVNLFNNKMLFYKKKITSSWVPSH